MLAQYNVANLWLNLVITAAAGALALWAGKVTINRMRPVCAMMALMMAVKVGGYFYLMANPEQEKGWQDVFRGVTIIERAVICVMMLLIAIIGRGREAAIRGALARQRQVLGDEDA